MAEATIPQPYTRGVEGKLPEHVLRGYGLYEVCKERILTSYQGSGRWIVPSGTTPGKAYEVRVGSRPERDKCECRGFSRAGHCSHHVAAQQVARRSAVCDACGTRCFWSQLQ